MWGTLEISLGNSCQIVILISTFFAVYVSFMDLEDLFSGTTVIAASFRDGVVMGADSRTSCSAYVANRWADKLTHLTDHIYCCRSGASSTTQAMAEHVGKILKFNQRLGGKQALVRDAAVNFRNEIYGAPIPLASVIVAGWDPVSGGQVYTVPASGLLVPESYAMSGSGSLYIQGYMSDNFKVDMDRVSAVYMVKTAVKLALQHDCATGGVVRIGVITEEGMKTSLHYNKQSDIGEFVNGTLWGLEF